MIYKDITYKDITYKDLTDKDIDTLFEELCNRVGADYNNISPQEEGWFDEYEWTEEEQGYFKKWLVNFFSKTLKMDKKEAEATSKWFISTYGWKLKK